MVDPESIDSRLEHLSDLLAESERIRAGGRAAYDATFRDRLAAQHAIQLAIQCCVDIGAHLIAELRLRMPDDYKGVFAVLREPLGLAPTRRYGMPLGTSTTCASLLPQSRKSRRTDPMVGYDVEETKLPPGYLLPEGTTMEDIRRLDLEILASEGIVVEGLPAKGSDEGGDPKEQT